MRFDEFCTPSASRLHSWNATAPGFRTLEQHFDDSNGEVIWKTSKKLVRKLTIDSDCGIAVKVVIKRYLPRNFYRYLLLPSPVRREAAGFMCAQSLGIPVVRLLGCAEERRLGMLRKCFLVTEFAEDSNGMNFAPGAAGRADEKLFESFVCRNLDFLARIHAAGFKHGGFHIYNILWHAAPDGTVECRWLDLATLRRVPFWRRRSEFKSDLNCFFNDLALSGEQRAESEKYYRNRLTRS